MIFMIMMKVSEREFTLADTSWEEPLLSKKVSDTTRQTIMKVNDMTPEKVA